MNTLLTAISLLGGLAMFLYGMEIMGDGLNQSSGTALKTFLGKLTHNTFLGLLTGMIVTAIIQSSTATIVLTVGLLSAGILNLRQSVSIVLGANIGTTITGQIIRLMDIDVGGVSVLSFFEPETLAPIALIAGIILVMFIKKGNTKNVGTIFMGFGILFTGLISMTASVEPIAQSEAFANILSYFSSMPVIGIFTGLVLTVIVQSSSAMIGILQALSSTGVMTFEVVYPIIFGIDLGTCVTTAIVCSIGASKDAKRTGLAHIIFNVVGIVIFMIALIILRKAGAFPNLWTSVVKSGGIANFNTLFKLVTAAIVLPFTGKLVKLLCRIVKDDPVEEDKYPELASLDDKLMISPAVALTEVNHVVTVMAKAAYDNFMLSLEQIKDFTPERSKEIWRYEERLDNFTDNSDNFLIKLSRHTETDKDNHMLTMLMQAVPSIERIGDYATNLDEFAQKMHEENLHFSDTAIKELDIISSAVSEILSLSVAAMSSEDIDTAHRIEPLEEVIDDMVLLLKDRHTQRLCQGICSINSGIIFVEMLTLLERAADQCSNLAMLIIGRDNESIRKNHHQYLEALHASGNLIYTAEQEMRRQQYMLPLEELAK